MRRYLPIVLLLLCAAGVRALALGEPYLGNFSSYQLISSSMARFFLREGFTDLLMPKLDVLVHGAPGLHLHYYPVASLLAALGSFLFGGSLEIWGRVQAIVFSVATAWFLYVLGRRFRGEAFGMLVAAVFAFAPISIIYGQSFLNESAGVFLVVLALYAALRFREGGKSWLALVVLTIGIGLVTRLNGFYVFLPLLVVWLGADKAQWARRFGAWVLVCAAACVLPALWYGYTAWVAQSNPHVYNCLLPQLGRQAPGGGLDGEFWLILGRTIGTLVLTPIGVLLGVWGLANPLRVTRFARSGGARPLGSRRADSVPPAAQRRPSSARLRDAPSEGPPDPMPTVFLFVWLAAVLVSFLLLPQKIKDHNFYTLHMLPPAAFFVAGGLEWMWQRGWKVAATAAIAAFCLFIVRYFANPVVKSVLAENADVPGAAEMAEVMIPADAKIIAARGSSNNLLYYADRRGWDFMVNPPAEVPYQVLWRWRFLEQEEIQRRSKLFKDPIAWLEHLRSQGASYFVVANSEELAANPAFRDYLTGNYPLVPHEGPGLIFELKGELKGQMT